MPYPPEVSVRTLSVGLGYVRVNAPKATEVNFRYLEDGLLVDIANGYHPRDFKLTIHEARVLRDNINKWFGE